MTDANFTSDSPVELGQPMHFTATVSPPNASTPLTYTWDFGAGPAQGNVMMTHTFATTGTHAVTLTVANPCGMAIFITTVKVLTPCLPVTDVSFTSDSPVELGQAMHFTAVVSPPDAGAPLTYTWDFDDASPPSVTEEGLISHTFATTGTYEVVLTVANPCSTANFTDTVEVETTPLAPDFDLVAWPIMQTITHGQSTTYTVIVTALHGFTDPVTLTLNDLPLDATSSWSANPVIPDGDSLLIITPSVTTPPGVYSLWITADGGLISHTVSLTLTVMAIPEPDLIVEQIITEPSIPKANEPFTLTVHVRNLGGVAITETFRMDWYANPSTPPVTSTSGTGYWLQNGLGHGASVEFTATHTFVSVEEHTLWAQVDRMNAVAEHNETNNLTGPVTVTVGLPDLHIPAITAIPSLLRENAPFTVTVRVRNQGIVGARGPFQVDWYEHLYTAPLSTTTGTISWTLGSLASGTTVAVTNPHSFSDVGIHRLWAQVDRLGQVSEASKDNNVTGPELVFVDRAVPTPTPMWTPTPAPALDPSPTPGPISPTVYIQSDIITNATWTANNVYVVVGRVTVNAGVALAIEPGTVIKFQQQTVSPNYKGKLIINGQLLAQGSVEHPIVFTSIHDDAYGGDTNYNGGSTWPKAGDWDGLLFSSSAGVSMLEHVIVAYGGADGNVAVNGASVTIAHAVIRDSNTSGLRWMNGASGEVSDSEIHSNLLHGLYLTAGSSPSISGNALFRNRNYAIYMQGNCLPAFSSNIAYGNAYNGVGVYGNLGTGIWYTDLPYLATENLIVESGSVLTLEPGTVVKFFSQRTLIIRGTLVASGTITSPIVFTSIKDDQYGGDAQQDGGATKPGPGDWGTLYFADTSIDADTILNHTIVRYGGYGYNYGSGTSYANITLDTASPRILNSFIENSNRYGLQLLNASSPTIDGNTIWENGDNGLWISAASSPEVVDNALVRNTGYAVYMSGGSRASFSGNVATGNRFNGIGVGGTINVDNAWGDNLPYVIDNSLTLAMNTTLTLQPGVVVKFPAGGQMTINGQLLAQGTADRRVIFTSLKDDAVGGDILNADRICKN